METTFRLLRVRGIPVGAHWTWAVAFVVVAGTLARSVLPSAYPGLGTGTHLLMAVATAGLLFGSVVLHELAHAVAARREGMPVEGITLWLLGGVSDVGGRARSPGQELRVAASGPAVSLLLAALLAAASAGSERLGGPESIRGVLAYAAGLNLLVAAFNLIPALPLDGGRILRAWLWHRQRDQSAATRSGARAGQAFGVTLLVVGVLNLWGGAGPMSVWLVVLGAFVVRAASSELADARTRHRLGRLTAADVMASDPGVVLHDTPVARLVEHPPAPERSGYPVLGGGRLLGVVALASARRVPSADRAGRSVQDVMTPLDDLPMVDAGDPVLAVVDRLNGGNPIWHAVVVADGCVVGILDEDDVARALERASTPPADGTGRGPDAGRGPADDGVDGRGPGVLAWIVVAAVCLVAGAALYRPPYVVVGPGPVVDVTGDVSVSGVPVTPVNGRYLVPTVELHRPSALGALVAVVRDGQRVVPVADAEYHLRGEVAGTDRALAAVAAARAQGLPATVAGTGARVVAVRSGSPADGVLRPGDVVLAADGRPVTLAGTLADLVRRRPAGTRLRLWVERGDRVRELTVTSGNEPWPSEAVGLGITVETRDITAELPFEVRFSGQGGVGPGAGLAYALAIADLLSPRDLAAGRTIAAAGTVEADGTIRTLGSTAPEADAAVRARASIFVVAPDQDDAARRDRLQVAGVENLARALEALSTTV